MPNWQPNWQDVRFDHVAAATAVAELRLTARRLRELLQVRGRSERTDLQGWTGPARLAWQQPFLASQREGNALAEACDREAAHIEAAAEVARQEQRARESSRAAWRREKAAEIAAAQALDEARRAQLLAASAGASAGPAASVPRGALR